MASRPVLELGPDTYSVFGSGVFGEGSFGGGAIEGSEVTGSCTGISITRGLSVSGVTETLEPGVCTVTLRDPALNPLSYEHTRPGQPLRVLCEDDGDRIPVFTGTISKATLLVEKDGDVSIVVTANDAVTDLANHPYETAHGGTFLHRVQPVLADAGVAYEITDPLYRPDAGGTLPTNQQTALGQLILARDSMHGFVYVDRDNVVQAHADQSRTQDPAAYTFTDGSLAGLDYIAIEPGFDSDQIINVLTIEKLTVGEGETETFTDEDSVATWGKHAQSVTVNDGDAENHALRFMARIAGPELTTDSVTVNATRIDALAEVSSLEPYTPVRVVRDGLLDQELQIMSIEHSITPRAVHPSIGHKWLTTVTLRAREVLPARWMDMPADMTWADVPAGMSWNDAITWHP